MPQQLERQHVKLQHGKQWVAHSAGSALHCSQAALEV